MYQQPESRFEYVVDKRASTAGEKKIIYDLMDQVNGWCSHQKASILVDIFMVTQPKTIVEIGVWGGKSLLPFARYCKRVDKGKVYGIDPWDSKASVVGINNESSATFWKLADHDEVYYRLVDVIYQNGLTDYVELIRSTSADAPLIEEIDILHIDGNHSDASSYLDVTKWVPQVRKGGWIILDDMNWFENGTPTTARAVEYLNTHCHKIAEIDESCLWGIWYKP